MIDNIQIYQETEEWLFGYDSKKGPFYGFWMKLKDEAYKNLGKNIDKIQLDKNSELS